MVYLFLLNDVSLLIFLGLGRNSRTSKDKLPVLLSVINLVSYRIPKLRCDLPFVYQSGGSADEKP